MDPRIPGDLHLGYWSYVVMDVPAEKVDESLNRLERDKIPDDFPDVLRRKPVSRF